MKIGKIPEPVLRRRVLKHIVTRHPRVKAGADVGRDCAVFEEVPGESVLLTTDPITGAAEDLGVLAVHTAVNDLAAGGGTPAGILLSVLLPENTREEQLGRIMEDVETVCRQLGIQIMGGHTEVTDAVSRIILTVTAVGTVSDQSCLPVGRGSVGEDLVVTKWIGLEGTAIAAKMREKELLARFPRSFVDSAQSFLQQISVLPEAKIAAQYGASVMHDVTEGGIYGALWELGEASGVGLWADLKKIPIRQETVEICNFLDLNPYGLVSGGSLLIAAKDGDGLVEALARAEIPAARIGKITEGRAKVLTNGDQERYLEPPKSDELYKLQ